MKTIVNKTAMPLRVPLPQGKVLHLGPKRSGQVSDTAVEHPALRKLIEAKQIEVQGEGADGAGGDSGGGGGGPSVGSQSKGKMTNVHRRGGQRGS